MPSLQCGKHAFLFPHHTIKFEKSNVIMYFWPRLLNCQTEKVPIQIDFSRTLPNSSKGINYFPKPSTKKLPSLDLKGKCTGLYCIIHNTLFSLLWKIRWTQKQEMQMWLAVVPPLPLSCQVNFCGCRHVGVSYYLLLPHTVHFTAMQPSK